MAGPGFAFMDILWRGGFDVCAPYASPPESALVFSGSNEPLDLLVSPMWKGIEAGLGPMWGALPMSVRRSPLDRDMHLHEHLPFVVRWCSGVLRRRRYGLR